MVANDVMYAMARVEMHADFHECTGAIRTCRHANLETQDEVGLAELAAMTVPAQSRPDEGCIGPDTPRWRTSLQKLVTEVPWGSKYENTHLGA